MLVSLSLCSALLHAEQDISSADTASVPPEKSPWFVSFSPSLGMTFLNASKATEETLNFQWIGSLQGRVEYEGSFFQWYTTVFAQYGQYNDGIAKPVRTQDNLIVSLRPSVTILPLLNIRLFFETTGETSMDKGVHPETEMSFLDPLFLYQTVFLGQRYAEDTDKSHFDFSYGAGYSVQQTKTDKYVLAQNRAFVLGENNPLSSVQEQLTLESGICGVFEINYRYMASQDALFNSSIKTVFMGKDGFLDDVKNSRVSSLITCNFTYKVFNLAYTNRILYDRNISLRRQLEQSLAVGIKFEL